VFADRVHRAGRDLILCGAREQPAKRMRDAELHEHVARTISARASPMRSTERGPCGPRREAPSRRDNMGQAKHRRATDNVSGFVRIFLAVAATVRTVLPNGDRALQQGAFRRIPVIDVTGPACVVRSSLLPPQLVTACFFFTISRTSSHVSQRFDLGIQQHAAQTRRRSRRSLLKAEL